MIRNPLIPAAALAAALTLAVPYANAASVPNNIAAAVADSNRPDADKQRDANRKPAETLAFTGVKSGEQVAELLPGGGYYTRIFSKAVGGSGHVYAVVPAPFPNAPADAPDLPRASRRSRPIRTTPMSAWWSSRSASLPCRHPSIWYGRRRITMIYTISPAWMSRCSTKWCSTT